jgi:CBS domain-containing membrane protein
MRKMLLNRLPSRRLVLGAETALDLMEPGALTLPAAMPVREAARILSERGLSAAPVVDDGGRLIGVLSRADLVRHASAAEESADRTAVPSPPPGTEARDRQEQWPTCRVGDLMTPVVLSLREKTPASAVADALLCLDVHQLFVTDEAGDLIGVISAKDIVRHLQFERPGDGTSPGRSVKP